MTAYQAYRTALAAYFQAVDTTAKPYTAADYARLAGLAAAIVDTGASGTPASWACMAHDLDWEARRLAHTL